MSRKDYIAVAKILAAHRECGSIPDELDFQFIMDDFCTMFKMDNSNFDRQKFRAACLSEADPMLGRVNAQESDYA